jgi:hypothetical protein
MAVESPEHWHSSTKTHAATSQKNVLRLPSTRQHMSIPYVIVYEKMVTNCYTPHIASLDFIRSEQTHAKDLRPQTHFH